jgi:HAD superfamily hydrolase (TIGR01509 family)
MAPTDLARFDAMLFDLDGVITDTASVHGVAWTRLFDEFLEGWSARTGEPFRPFDPDQDYRRHVDGRRRQDGITQFLASRGIDLPAGGPDDDDDALTVAGLGRRKDRWFNEALSRDGVQVFDDGVRLVERLHELGKSIAVVSASENCVPVLRRAGLLHLFPVQVTGLDAKALDLPGKPAPDTFVEGARRLGVEPARTVVFEDAIAGVEAGRAGGFGLVVGVDRTGVADELRAGGADVVVSDLGELSP